MFDVQPPAHHNSIVLSREYGSSGETVMANAVFDSAKEKQTCDVASDAVCGG
jgi:hypothetical protein